MSNSRADVVDLAALDLAALDDFLTEWWHFAERVAVPRVDRHPI
ncbi:hypothetical protein ACGFNP_28335 [Nonomuraea sp. NPDC049269]